MLRYGRRRRLAAALLVALVMPLWLASMTGRASAALPGDCNGDGKVTIDELIIGVNIALGTAPVSACAAFDQDDSGSVTIGELIAAVNAALVGATPSPTRSATLQPTASPTPQLNGPELIQGGEEIALENVGTFTVLSFGTVGSQPSQATTSALRGRLRLAARPRTAIAPLDPALAASMCTTGTAEVSPCMNDTITITYDKCLHTLSSGHTVVENGTVAEHVTNAGSPPVFCTTGQIRVGDTDQLTYTGYQKTELDGDASVAELDATITEAFTKGDDGCLSDGTPAQNGSQAIDGMVAVTCLPSAESVTCPPGGTNRVVTATNLTIGRTSGGFPCQIGLTATGALSVSDRAATDVTHPNGITFTQAFDGFLMAENPNKDDPTTSEFQELGNLSVDCLGGLNYMTAAVYSKAPNFAPITFPQGAACPTDGTFEVGPSHTGTGQVIGDRTVPRPAANVAQRTSREAASVGNTYSDQLFRASNGPVYQVLQEQNGGDDVMDGANGFQVTSLIATQTGSLTECAKIANATVNPEAGVVVDAGSAFPLSQVFRSPIIADATPPCFNLNYRGGDGGVCIGPDCVACTGSTCNCVGECPAGGQCIEFSLHDKAVSTPVTQSEGGVPAAGLASKIEPLPSQSTYPNCRGLDGGDTYGFGLGGAGPTIDTQQCGPTPADGLVLQTDPSPPRFVDGTPGSTLIFAYDSSLASAFAAGSAGFVIDSKGDNFVCGKTAGVLNIGHALANQIDAPIIHFATVNDRPSAQFIFAPVNFSGNFDTVDKTASCPPASPLGCCPPIKALLQCR